MYIPTTTLTQGGTGNFTLISDSTLGADAANFDLTGIPGTYKHLQVICDLRSTDANPTVHLLVRLNNDSGANYDDELLLTSGTTEASGEHLAGTSLDLGHVPGSTAPAGRSAAGEIRFPNYTGTAFHKNALADLTVPFSSSSGNHYREVSSGVWLSTAAVTRITILPAAGNFLAGSRVTLYGLS